ncbi:FIST C-terminal domain-containing protein [Pseudomonadota bacterium]
MSSPITSKSAIATGLSYGHSSTESHGINAVNSALEKLNGQRANSVLLFLTHEYASNPKPTLRAVARAANCTQIFGGTGCGLLTDEEWVIDGVGAAAMVFSGDTRLEPMSNATSEQKNKELAITFTTPDGLSSDWLDTPTNRIGSITSDAVGHGPFAVWTSGRVATQGVVSAWISGTQHAVVASQGFRALCMPQVVAEVNGHDLLRIGNASALKTLVTALPFSIGKEERVPLHLLMYGVTYGDPNTAIEEGRYHLNHILTANVDDNSITLTDELSPGESLFWAIRDKLAAERDMQHCLETAHSKLAADPDFALLFPCLSRGPSFYGNRDRDIDLLKTRFKDIPLAGFYGNGQIAPLQQGSHLYHYSTVAGLFRCLT